MRKIYFIKKRFQTLFILGFTVMTVIESFGIGLLLYYLLYNRLTNAIYKSHIKIKTTGELIKPILINVNTGVALTVILIVIIFAMIIIRRTENSLNIFKEATQRVGKGDLTYKIDYQSPTLTGELVHFFNNMVEKIRGRVDTLKSDLEGIENSIKGLDQRLRERTHTKDQLQEDLRSISMAADRFKEDLRRFKV